MLKKKSGKLRKQIPLLLIMFLVSLLAGCGSASKFKPAQPASANAIANGSVENGRNLFMGYVHFQNDGPPCMGCHSIGDNGLLGGGAMGPNLTDVSTRLHQTDLVSVLSNFGPKISPVMQPIYTTHPLTESEQADLIAFMNASVGEPEVDREWQVVVVSLGGSAAAALCLGFIYRKRLRSVRRALLNKAQKELL